MRLLVYILAMAVAVVGAVWLADRPGSVSVVWLDWRLDTSVPILLLAIAIAVAAILVLWRVLRWTTGAPVRVVMRRRALRQQRGYQALAHGMAAAAAGHGKEARRHAARAEKLLADPALTSVLSAQAATLTGDGKGAHGHFAAMLEHPETAALGLRGLLREALAAGDRDDAIELAERARRLNPDDPWLVETLFGLLVQAGRAKDAEALVEAAGRRRGMPPSLAQRRRAVLAHMRALEAQAAGQLRAALEHARRAVKSDPSFSVAAAALALQHGAAGEKRRALRVLADAWKRSPGPELVAAARKLGEGEAPLAHLRQLEKITAGNPDHPEAHKSLGEAALAARLWGEARRHLLAAVQSRPTQGVFRLLAKLEEAEFGDQAAAHGWLDKAAHASPDPAWACTACGAPAAEWTLLCPSCHAVDTLAWIAPKPAPAEAETHATAAD